MTVKLILIFVVIIPKQSSHYVCLLLTVLDSVCQINKTIKEMYIWKNVKKKKKKKKRSDDLRHKNFFFRQWW